ncbi:ethanolamine ammonia-lyase light chain [Oceanotoga teriensis]|uniref:Ethanolamine ammonia-lyase small subunit n=1 Tax=Oceanotoga teriensis TaxID=515440 RepID=A0AA45HJI2_9BACT|nr:ethanolamine ammonia-lyase subunit EutC [Oceanotoga teriensis]PWJ95945.1 ethanolamine ammonia-lyase light chain [Oceanotoga teriensis]
MQLESSELKKLVEQVLNEMTSGNTEKVKEEVINKVQQTNNITSDSNIEEGCIEDITETDLKTQLLVENPADREGYLKMKQNTPARIGVGRAGVRYKTLSSLRFRADHAAAQDAVFSYVSDEFLNEMGLFTVQSKCKTKDEYITRPDLGRKINEEGIDLIKEKCKINPTVQILIADGLSSSAIEANLKDILPSIVQGLKGFNIDIGTTFFVKLGRVGVMDHVSEITNAEVTCLLVGERPGLVTAESMSAYIAYKAKVNMPEARRTVISNIHKGGTSAVEAGAHIAELIKTMLEKKASGIELKA